MRLIALEGAIFVASAGVAGLVARGTFGGVLAHPQALAITSAIGIVVGTALGLLGLFAPALIERHFPLAVHLCLFGVPLIVTAAMYAIGPKWIGAVVLYVEVPIFAFYLVTRRLAIVTLLAIGAQFGAVLVFQPGYPAPVVEWLALGGTLGVIGAIFGLFLDRADAIADSEREARSELAGINTDLEQQVRRQVEELDRLQRLRRFLSPQVAEAVLAGDDEGMLEAHRRKIAVLFCDLRGFTSFTSAAEPEEVLDVLGDYYATVGQRLHEVDATIGSFAGDGIMAYFNDPVPCEDPALIAVRTAIGFREPMASLMTSWSRRGFRLGYGVGIAFGYATLGTVGFEGRNDYTALGSVVNLAARLCGEAASEEVLVDERTHDVVGPFVEWEQREVTLKGIQQPLPVFSVLRVKEVATSS